MSQLNSLLLYVPFMNESPEIQKQMSEKFREIQKAYESIVNS